MGTFKADLEELGRLPPACVEGLDWLTEVDTTIGAWCPDAG
ncbi:hypothetical protein [Nocardia sp. NBC_01009]|nr:hypothetical protein OHA42_14595 [Nocardia sp. NBC_01009]